MERGRSHSHSAGDSSSPRNRVSIVLSWASQLASESRNIDWILRWYVWPDAVRLILCRLDMMQGGAIGLVGLQGVGKSSVLLAILTAKIILRNEHRTREQQKNVSEAASDTSDMILFKWRRQAERREAAT